MTIFNLFEQVFDGIKKLNVLGVLPVLSAFLVLFGSVVINHDKRDIWKPLQDIKGVKKYYKTEKIYDEVDMASGFLIILSILSTLFLFIALFNVKFETYIYGMLAKIEVVGDSVISLTTMAITLAVVIVLFDKKYYLVFSIKEVLQEYKFYLSMTIAMGSCVAVSVLVMTLLDQSLTSYFDFFRLMFLEEAVICNVISVLYIFSVTIKVMFSDKKIELKLLRKLYRVFWLHRPDKIHIRDKKDWDRESVDIHIEYLAKKYVNICNKIKTEKIEEIEFSTTIGKYKDKWYGKARNRFIKIMVMLVLLSALISVIALEKQSMGLIIFNIIISLAVIGCTFLPKASIELAILRLYSDTWGYYVRERGGKERLIPRAGNALPNKFDRYFMNMNSLNAFFYLFINIGNGRAIWEEGGDEAIKWLENLKEINMFTYLPVFTIGFFIFDKDMKPESIREAYKLLELGEAGRFRFLKLLQSQIFYLTRNCYEELFGYEKTLNLYMQWLEGDSADSCQQA